MYGNKLGVYFSFHRTKDFTVRSAYNEKFGMFVIRDVLVDAHKLILNFVCEH